MVRVQTIIDYAMVSPVPRVTCIQDSVVTNIPPTEKSMEYGYFDEDIDVEEMPAAKKVLQYWQSGSATLGYRLSTI